MFCYLTSYRFYTLAKVGFGLAYLWFIWDFFWIHVAYWHGLDSLLSDPSGALPFNLSAVDRIDLFLAAKPAVWLFAAVSPLVVALYLWGRYRWLQLGVGYWMNLSMIAMISRVGIFCSTADVWLSCTLAVYSLAALTCPRGEWHEREPGFDLAKWREDPVVASSYAWLVVLVQFAVYFFAGFNKLIDGWEPWTSGVALQNLSVDSSMHDYARGIPVPYLVSLILCYITLFQRLVVPFGFFFMRYRGWAVLILGSMHLGYDLLMQVAIFPLIGVSGLLMIVPPRSLALPLFSRPSLHQPRVIKRILEKLPPHGLLPRMALFLFSLWLLVESARLTFDESSFWERRLVMVPAWRMFADGGINAGKKWVLLLQTPSQEIDGTPFVLEKLPHLWRDRFYMDQMLHYVMMQQAGEQVPPVDDLIRAAQNLYGEQQLRERKNPAILNARFEITRTSVRGGQPLSSQ